MRRHARGPQNSPRGPWSPWLPFGPWAPWSPLIPGLPGNPGGPGFPMAPCKQIQWVSAVIKAAWWYYVPPANFLPEILEALQCHLYHAVQGVQEVPLCLSPLSDQQGPEMRRKLMIWHWDILIILATFNNVYFSFHCSCQLCLLPVIGYLLLHIVAIDTYIPTCHFKWWQAISLFSAILIGKVFLLFVIAVSRVFSLLLVLTTVFAHCFLALLAICV